MRIEALRMTGLAMAFGLATGIAAPAAFAETAKDPNAMQHQSQQHKSGQYQSVEKKAAQQRASTSMIQDESDNRGTRALNLLMAKGYTEYTDFQKQGKNYTAKVSKDGETMQVVINPDAGTITEKQS